MKEYEAFTPKQVAERIKERRADLKLTMAELAGRLGVNKSTIQRYENDGIDPRRTMVINSLAEELRTTPEWLLGLSDEKEIGIYEACREILDSHIRKYLVRLLSDTETEWEQKLLTALLGNLIDLYTVFCRHYAKASKEAARLAEDEALKESLAQYEIDAADLTEQIYRKELKTPVESMKTFLEGLLHIYDAERPAVSLGDLSAIVSDAESRLEADDPDAGRAEN